MVYAVHKAGATVAGSDDACRPGRSRGYVAVVRTVGYGVDHRCSGNSVGERHDSGYMISRSPGIGVLIGILSLDPSVVVAAVDRDPVCGAIHLSYESHTHKAVSGLSSESHGGVACHIADCSIAYISGDHPACTRSSSRDFKGAGGVENYVLYCRSGGKGAEKAVVLPCLCPVRDKLQVADTPPVAVEIACPGIARDFCVRRTGRAYRIPDWGPVRYRRHIDIGIEVHSSILVLPLFYGCAGVHSLRKLHEVGCRVYPGRSVLAVEYYVAYPGCLVGCVLTDIVHIVVECDGLHHIFPSVVGPDTAADYHVLDFFEVAEIGGNKSSIFSIVTDYVPVISASRNRSRRGIKQAYKSSHLGVRASRHYRITMVFSISCQDRALH